MFYGRGKRIGGRKGKGRKRKRGGERNIQHQHLHALLAWLLVVRGGRLCRRLSVCGIRLLRGGLVTGRERLWLGSGGGGGEGGWGRVGGGGGRCMWGMRCGGVCGEGGCGSW